MDNEKALDLALGQITKQFGEGAVMKMGEKATMNIESVPTGALALDLALGVGGLPSRVTEIYGPESSGKNSGDSCRGRSSRMAEYALILMLSMQWTLCMQGYRR